MNYFEIIQSQIEDITIPQLIAIAIILIALIWYCFRKKRSTKNQEIELSKR